MTRKPAVDGRALFTRWQVGPGDQLFAHPGGHLGLDGGITRQWGDGAHVGVGVQQLVTTEHHYDRHHGQDAGHHHQHPCQHPPTPRALVPRRYSGRFSASFSRCSSSTSCAGLDVAGAVSDLIVGAPSHCIGLSQSRDRCGPPDRPDLTVAVAAGAARPGPDAPTAVPGPWAPGTAVDRRQRRRPAGAGQARSLAFCASNSASLMTPFDLQVGELGQLVGAARRPGRLLHIVVECLLLSFGRLLGPLVHAASTSDR